jgi:ribosome-associated translation inhibitor RaiA
MEPVELTFEFYAEVPNLRAALKDELRAEAHGRLQALAADHTDLIGASIALERPAHGASPYLYKVRVVVYARPEHVVATEQGGDLRSTLKGALDAVERQVRERREKLAERWKQP